jgi:hypothetical protein
MHKPSADQAASFFETRIQAPDVSVKRNQPAVRTSILAVLEPSQPAIGGLLN